MTIQVPSALLEAFVLASLRQEDAYGYSLTQSIKQTLDVSESTLYPVMRRLETEGCLATYDQPHNGRNRRYYKITEIGLAKYKICLKDWEIFRQKVDKLIERSQK
ncbi:PadR family transcriptional regulator [Candidatus Saccharibacteria bacterium]|nr:PadR family transcriptional regulator [Candidatus Saccharibacteria bacterium]